MLESRDAKARLCYILPLVLNEEIDDDSDAANYKICQWAWCNLRNIVQRRLRWVAMHVYIDGSVC